MPWKECHVVEERLRFIARLLDGEKMAGLCREFGISRKTGYKIYDRYQDCGLDGLTELFRVLRAIGVNVKRLVRYLYLWQRQDRALLIKERRAHVYEMQAKAGRPLFNVLITGFERYANRLKKKGCPVPPRVDNAVFALLNALEASVNAITDRMEGEPPSSDDRTAAPAGFPCV